MIAATDAPADDVEAHSDFDEALAEVEGRMNLLLHRVRFMWKEAATRVHPELQPSGYKLLSYIARTGTANAHQLAEVFEMDKSVVSRQVRMLEESGLLESRPDERDGRLRVLTATPPALTALGEVRREHETRLRHALAVLSPAELVAAAKVLRHIAEI